jgi:hypothetical protein
MTTIVLHSGQHQGGHLLREFMVEIKEVFGWATEVSYAIAREHHTLLELKRNNPDQPNIRNSYSLKQSDGSEVSHHESHSDDIAERMKPDGESIRRLRNASIVYFYTLWEDNYRDKLAKLIGGKRNDVTSDLFGDLKDYRHAIAHSHGRLAVTPKVLTMVKRHEQVSLSHEQFAGIFQAISSELSRLALDHFGLDLTFHTPIQVF